MTFGDRDDPSTQLRRLLREELGERDRPARGAEDAEEGEEPGTGRHAVASVPLGLRDRLTAVSHPVVLTFLVVAVVAGVVFGLRLARAKADAELVPLLRAGTGSSSPSAASGGMPDPSPGAGTSPTADPASAAPSSAGAQVRVHVVGQVRRPGVVSLAAGARVLEAIEAAGGAGAKADLAAVNLARPVVDGEQIRVPKPGEEATAAPGLAGSAAGASPGSQPGMQPGAVPGGSGTAKVSLNTADVAALDTLPGVGPVLAQRIIDWRQQHGRFTSLDQLGEVSGIGEKVLARLTPLVSL